MTVGSPKTIGGRLPDRRCNHDSVVGTWLSSLSSPPSSRTAISLDFACRPMPQCSVICLLSWASSPVRCSASTVLRRIGKTDLLIQSGTHPEANSMEAQTRQRWLQGCATRRHCPNADVDRATMAVFDAEALLW